MNGKDGCRAAYGGRRGSFTIEAALVMSAVIIVLSLLVLAFLLLYHRALLTRTACGAAQQAALLWPSEADGLYSCLLHDALLEAPVEFSVSMDGASDLNGAVGANLVRTGEEVIDRKI